MSAYFFSVSGLLFIAAGQGEIQEQHAYELAYAIANEENT